MPVRTRGAFRVGQWRGEPRKGRFDRNVRHEEGRAYKWPRHGGNRAAPDAVMEPTGGARACAGSGAMFSP